VTITDRRGAVLYEDPIPLHLDGGGAYREYEIEVEAEPPVRPVRGRQK
jgi:hypothetical protein